MKFNHFKSFYLFSFFLLVVNLHVDAQTTINNNIKAVKNLNIYGRNAKVSIGTMIVNESLKTKLYYISSNQKKDTSNNYITTFILGNNDNLPLFNAEIVLKFDKPVIEVNNSCEGFEVQAGLSDNKLLYVFKAQQLMRSVDDKERVKFSIISKEIVKTQIMGTSGNIPIVH